MYKFIGNKNLIQNIYYPLGRGALKKGKLIKSNNVSFTFGQTKNIKNFNFIKPSKPIKLYKIKIYPLFHGHTPYYNLVNIKNKKESKTFIKKQEKITSLSKQSSIFLICGFVGIFLLIPIAMFKLKYYALFLDNNILLWPFVSTFIIIATTVMFDD